MIKAAITLTHEASLHMDQDELKNYVLYSLAKNISREVTKIMTIDKTEDILSGTITYTGSVHTSSNTISVSPTYNATVSNGTTSPYVQINLRVVEYTKNGKVTRVELQKYDESNDDWLKIPRLQIEE